MLVGISMLHSRGAMIVCVLGVALYLVCLDRASIKTALWMAVGFDLGLGVGSGFWVPEALQGLGASRIESWAGMGLTTLWAGLPQSILITIGCQAVRPRTAQARIVWTSVVVYSTEHLILVLPGSVPWTLLGYSAVDDPGLAQLASVGGVPLVSAVIAGLGRAVAELFSRSSAELSWRASGSLIAGLAISSLFGLEASRLLESPLPAGESSQFLIIQPNIPRVERHFPSSAMQRATLDRMTAASSQALASIEKSDRVTIVWPETSVVIGPQGVERAQVESALRSLGRSAIVGASLLEGATDEPVRNAILSFDNRGIEVARTDKSVGVPIIESSDDSSLHLLGQALIGQAGRGRKVRLDSRLAPIGDSSRAIVLLCFEALFPSVADARRPEGARVILNLADDSWIESPYPTRQLTAILRFRAIEQRLPAIRVAHGGLSASFDRFGQPGSELPLDQYGWLLVDVFPVAPPGLWQGFALLVLPVGGTLLTYFLTPWIVKLWRFSRPPAPRNR